MMADKKEITKLLKTTKGQIEGILKMVEEDRYCIDVSNQLLASIAILKKINLNILNSHLNHCIKNASGENLDNKILEITKILNKLGQ